MDIATATSLGISGKNYILDATTTANEFGGREAILNRVFNTGKIKYEKDNDNYWDIATLIEENGFTVDADTSKSKLDGEVEGEKTIYKFDGTDDLSALTISEGLKSHSSGSYVGGAGETITVPLTGKCYVEVYGFYSGTVEVAADTQGKAVMFFNNNSTSIEIENDYIVYDADANQLVITLKATTYITKIVVEKDDSIVQSIVESIDISTSSSFQCVGVAYSLSAKVNPGTATNKTVFWSSSDETVAKIDMYTGKVTFLKAGDVTFTATAADGSGVTNTITCKPIEATWTKAEWYTTDGTLATETGAESIGVFDVGNSSKKALKVNNVDKSYTFTNLAGTSISTATGLKLNSGGKLTIATTKGNAILTLITVREINYVAAPSVMSGSKQATFVGVVENADGTNTYTYVIPSAGAWEITRGDTSNECNPLLYASCVYDTTISKNTFVNYKGGSYSAKNSNAAVLNHNNEGEGSSKVADTNEVTYDNITYKGAKSNGNNNWLKINKDATITFNVKTACTLYLKFHGGAANVTVTLDGTPINTTTDSTGATQDTAYAYNISAGGTVVITSTVDNTYLGCLEVEFSE